MKVVAPTDGARFGTGPVDKQRGTEHEPLDRSADVPVGSKRKRAQTAFHGQPSSRKARPERINTPPSQKLDIYVCGSGEFGELGLGSRRTVARYPRLNDLLDAKTVGVTAIAVGGMHCVALTHDQKILTWGVNDAGALGRETYWDEAPMRDVDDPDDQDADEEVLNPRESTPTAIPTESFASAPAEFAQVVATDSASFALTVDGFVYGWGTFSVSAACAVRRPIS